MPPTPPSKLHNNGKAGAEGFSRRERQIMDALYALERATAAQIHEAMAEPPSYTAVRTLLTILEKKGHVRHESDGVRYVYAPVAAREDAGKSAIQTLKKTFFDNSAERLVAALITEEDIAPDELDRLAVLINRARREGR
ncbi:MAG: BlaI/MecI/CopY family transcriptional regulator [Caulobacteraceae bacterium]